MYLWTPKVKLIGNVTCAWILKFSKSQHMPIHGLFPGLELENDPSRFSLSP